MASADRLIEVFNEAKARPVGAERDHFLSEACRDEPELKQQVLSLLQAHEGAGDFLKNKQAIPPVTVLTEKPGRYILSDNEKTEVVADSLLQPVFCLRAGVRHDAVAPILPRAVAA
jgi:hypothetical protein